jgi:hypothetical protein
MLQSCPLMLCSNEVSSAKRLIANVVCGTVLLSFLQAEQELGQLHGNLQDQQSMTKQEAQRVSRDSTDAA